MHLSSPKTLNPIGCEILAYYYIKYKLIAKDKILSIHKIWQRLLTNEIFLGGLKKIAVYEKKEYLFEKLCLITFGLK